jgi:SAM-dependent methyltransferase
LFNPLAAVAVKRVVKYLKGEKTVIEFGNQRLDPSLEGGDVAGFYKLLGFTEYLALDVNTKMGAIVADLNDPDDVTKAIAAHRPANNVCFDLVTNNGTGEHIFNQAAVFESAHWLCKPGGVMLHILPFTPWINHGFYNYNPILFRDLAAANGYEIKFFLIGDRWGNYHDCSGWPDLFLEKRPVELQKMVSQKHWRGDVFLACAFQRPEKFDVFRVPLQGKYVGDVADDGLAAQYRRA